MNYMIMVSHGELSAGVHSALKMMCGNRQEVMAVGLEDEENLADFKLKFESLIDKMDFEADRLIVCADIQGGSPFTSAVGILSERGILDKCLIFSGLNLPMAITVCIMKDSLDENELIATALQEARIAVTHFDLR